MIAWIPVFSMGRRTRVGDPEARGWGPLAGLKGRQNDAKEKWAEKEGGPALIPPVRYGRCTCADFLFGRAF